MHLSRILRAFLLALSGAILAVALVALGRALWTAPEHGGGRDASVTGTALVGGPFTLTDQDGARRSDTEFRGKLMLVYFGFIFCPDACPTALQEMSSAVDMLGRAGDQVQPLFITVDPERDTVEMLKSYVPNFHPRLVGLTGTAAEIASAAKAYRVYYAKATGSERDYLVDHSSLIYLMDRQGKYLTHFSHGTPADKMAAAIRKFL